ncbi:MAG: phosphatase PAP2 family protein [Brevundimonas sp.]|uniref:phosphatase PAP2 family protein n=1 Tax=Brevundimonas sp. TaxID=1871086 RepID=UPI0025C296B9|nr:phosphatase PAP2 family protein [Brevundimonas sp.]MBX3478520.1 phosphatase PAP2 family protein [Brevundimonas sp.]
MTVADLAPFLRRALSLARTEFAVLGALLVVALGTMTFIEIADEMAEADGRAFDQAVLAWMQPTAGHPRGPWWLQEAAGDVTSLGGIAVLGLFAVAAVGFLLIQRKRLSALLLVLGLAGGVALSEGLKALFERERPPAAYQAVETLNASFPSGHALLSTVFYLSVAVMMTRAFPQRGLKAYVLGVGMGLAALVGLTRVYLGAHWASDVMAGWCVGAAWAMTLWLAAYAAARFQKTHHAALQDQAAPFQEDQPT